MVDEIDIFIAYKREERALAEEYSMAFREAGYVVSIDIDAQVGIDFGHAIDELIARSRLVIVLWTPSSVASRWVRAEANEAIRQGKYLGVRAGAVSIEDLPIQLRSTNWIDVANLRRGGRVTVVRDEVARIISSQKTPKEPSLSSGDLHPATTAAEKLAEEIDLFRSIEEIGEASGYQDYLVSYPDGVYVEQARHKLAELGALVSGERSSQMPTTIGQNVTHIIGILVQPYTYRILKGVTIAITAMLGLVFLSGKALAPSPPTTSVADLAMVDGIERKAVLTGTPNVRIYERHENEQLIGIVRGHDSEIVSARFLSSGRFLVTADREGVEQITRVDDLSRLVVVEDDHLGWMRRVFWLPYGKPVHDWMGGRADWVERQITTLVRWIRNRLFMGSTAWLWFQPGQRFRDCDGCPEMIVIPGGRFRMGSDAANAPQEERPSHDVTVQRFALGVTEVTRDEFEAFVQENGEDFEEEPCASPVGRALSWRDPGFPQSGDHPVVCVSLNAAQKYVDWLNKKASEGLYRLPSEAELEFAMRVGWTAENSDTVAIEDLMAESSTTLCSFVNFLDASAQNDVGGTGSKCNDRHSFTAPGRAFAVNRYGLYNLAGNASEWTADCWHPNYEGAPSNGLAWTAGDTANCVQAVLRGGSFLNNPMTFRSMSRDSFQRSSRRNNIGFRVARTLKP